MEYIFTSLDYAGKLKGKKIAVGGFGPVNEEKVSSNCQALATFLTERIVAELAGLKKFYGIDCTIVTSRDLGLGKAEGKTTGPDSDEARFLKKADILITGSFEKGRTTFKLTFKVLETRTTTVLHIRSVKEVTKSGLPEAGMNCLEVPLYGPWIDFEATDPNPKPAPKAAASNLPEGPVIVKDGRRNVWGDILGLEFVLLPAGCYQMGSVNWAALDEQPVHQVCLSEFWLARHEVTQGQWKQVMGYNPSEFKKGDDYPVENVDWTEAEEFVRKLNAMSGGGRKYRLPTEAEWEYACRSGGKAEKYAGGDQVDRFGWYLGNSRGLTQPVGKKEPNSLGLYDMSGNVWEWCQDLYSADAYEDSQPKNPLNKEGGPGHVRRGGSSGDVDWNLRCTERGGQPAGKRYTGLRLVLIP
ncbi:MAG: SUMF1/EgtB/PvdO family nonheme iron enzyme [Deltaproteobacteria bacterium]|nr:SUMF1/EgtB/PvdO family nonheme iron enzyme [Deltaproteobacteria bacterium]